MLNRGLSKKFKFFISDLINGPGNPTLADAGKHVGVNADGKTLDYTSAGIPNIGTTNGDIIYFDGSAWQRLEAGSDDEVLTLASGVPSWTADVGQANTPITENIDYNNFELQNAILKAYSEVGKSVTSSGGSTVLNNSNSNNFYTTLIEATTITITNPPVAGIFGFIFFEITQHASAAKAVTFGSEFDFGDDGAPDLSTLSSVNTLVFYVRDGGTKFRSVTSFLGGS